MKVFPSKRRGEKEAKEVKTPKMSEVEKKQQELNTRLRWIDLQTEALRRGKA